MIATLLKNIPLILHEKAQQCFTGLQNFLDQAEIDLTENDQQEILQVLLSSQFVFNYLQRKPHWISEALRTGFYHQAIDKSHWSELFDRATETAKSSSHLGQIIRDFRNQHMIRIAWRDLTGLAGLQETMQDLSSLADICIQGSLNWLHTDLKKTFGTPVVIENGLVREIEMIVLGMGKLGAAELNYSSDIDLIFVFPAQGKTCNGKRTLSNKEYFIKLGRQLIQILDERTAYGYVFRVDMRLRPFGKSGPLVISINAMEEYYARHGREWERYAMIKARMITGAEVDQQAMREAIRPFIYRRYVDFGVFESLREMKQMIANEVKLRSLEHNIKLGSGGIREIEFLAQAFQLLRGGRETDLQQPQVQLILALLKEKKIIPGYVVNDLLLAYTFLRNTEHRIQEYADEQTHLLPDDEISQARLAYSMGYESWDPYYQRLSQHRQKVHENFMQLFQLEPINDLAQKQQGYSNNALEQLWSVTIRQLDDDVIVDSNEVVEHLTSLGFNQAEQVLKELLSFRQSQHYRKMSAEGHNRLDKLMPLVLNYLLENKHSLIETITQVELLKRLIDVFENVCRRSAYLALLIENPLAMSQLIQLCAASAWISREMNRTPALLDELLDPRVLYSPLNKTLLTEDLQHRLMQISVDDLEQQMEVLRHFKQAHILRVAAADVTGAIPVIKVSDYLTWIAETVVDAVIDIAWLDTVKKLGLPLLAHETLDKVQADQVRGFAAIGYGKIGGKELGYGSDLDLVFIFDDVFISGQTQGNKSIDNSLFFIRLGQKIMHIIGVRTYSGVLYECDMRLRPNGNSGQVASSMTAFKNYQHNNAWIWEHQALCRARFIAGDQTVESTFNQIRKAILSQQRDTYALKKEVSMMRQKMRDTLETKQSDLFDVKQAQGGIVDIEFMVQFLILNHAFEYPLILQFSDNLCQLEKLSENNILDKSDSDKLAQIYQQYRGFMHQQALQETPALAKKELFETQRQLIRQYWKRIILE